jgi:hypothetical protein
MNVIETSSLGKRYGGTWALRECTLAIPAGHVAALVGWLITVLAVNTADGRVTAAVTSRSLVLPDLAFAACCGALVVYATQIPRGTR